MIRMASPLNRTATRAAPTLSAMFPYQIDIPCLIQRVVQTARGGPP
jgi:hypothetical protein